MKKLKKILLVAIALFVLLVAAVVLFIGPILSAAVKTGAETVGPRVTGTSVTLASADISPFSGSAGLSGLVIGNPEGYNTPHAFKMDEISAKVDPGSIFSDLVVVEEILIDGAEITYELGSGGGNLIVIKKNATASDSSSAPETKTEAKEETAAPEKAEDAKEEKSEAASDSSEKKVVIKSFVLKNCQLNVSAALLKGKMLKLPMPELKLTDIGQKEGGVTAKEAAKQLLDQVIPLAVKTAANNKELPSELLNMVNKDNKYFDSEKLIEAGKEIGEKAKDAAKKTTDTIKGLFGK